MRVMLVVNEFPPEKIAGTAMATKALAEQLSAKGHQVCVVVTTTCPQDKQIDISTHDYDLIWLKPRPFRGLGWFWRIGQTLKHARFFQPEVIQGQAVSCGLVAGMVGRILNIPSLCYAQGYDVYQASWWQRKTEIRWGCALPDQCLAVTQNLKQAIGEIIDVQVDVLPHAFTLPKTMQSRQQTRQKYHVSDTTRLVLNVARLEDFKGHDVLLKAWQGCLLTCSEAQLWIVGTGSLQTYLENMVIKLGLQKNVRFFGFLPQQDVHQMMGAVDVFVLPSREEPFGIVLLEAMAQGLPVVASNIGGIPEVVPENEDVQLVLPDDINALKKAVQKWSGKKGGFSDANRQHAMRFEWRQQVKRFESIYRQLLATNGV